MNNQLSMRSDRIDSYVKLWKCFFVIISSRRSPPLFVCTCYSYIIYLRDNYNVFLKEIHYFVVISTDEVTVILWVCLCLFVCLLVFLFDCLFVCLLWARLLKTQLTDFDDISETKSFLMNQGGRTELIRFWWWWWSGWSWSSGFFFFWMMITQ